METVAGNDYLVQRKLAHAAESRSLGNIVWQDDFQVAAFPSKSDDRITVQYQANYSPQGPAIDYPTSTSP